MLFKLLQPIISFITSQFFSEIRLSGEAQVKDDPLIVVANHPNVMLDGLLVLYTFDRQMWFLAKSTIFNNWLKSYVLHFFHFVPIYRKQDAGELMTKNEESFRAAADILKARKAILIFPEGKSLGERKLNPVKTGAARIAFQTEDEADFQLGLKIQVLGLTYGDFFRFQSTVTTTLSKPISVKDYESVYRRNPREAVTLLSKEIEKQLKATTVEVHDSKYENLVIKISKLYQSKGVDVDDRQRINIIAKEAERLESTHGMLAEGIERRIDQYLHLCRSLRVDGSKKLTRELNRFFLYPSAPFILLGALVHLPAFRIVARLVNWLSNHKSQLASWQISLAFLVFPLWYIVIGLSASIYWEEPKLFLRIIFLVAASGLLAKNYLHELFLLIFSALWPSSRTPIEVLTEIRDDLIRDLELLRKTENNPEN